MAKYSDIKGFTVQTLSTDTVASQAAGGSWASGGDLNTARYQGGGAGVQTAASLFGGGAPAVAVHEYYNGTSWSEQTDLNTGRYSVASGGTQTGSLIAGGYTTTNVNSVETWNGSSWTEVAEINTSRRGLSSLGQVNTAILAAGGYTTTAVNNVENWNGSSWTEIAEITTTGYSAAGSGTNTEGLIINVTPGVTNQYWNGSSWTELADTNTEHSPGGGGSQQGSYTSALIFGGGNPTSLAVTESWDGSSWTEVADLATARRGIRGAGAASSALAMGGEIPPTVASTEEFTAPATFNQIQEGQLFFNSTANAFKETITDFPGGTWASNTAMPTATTERWGTGTSNSNAMIGSPPGAAMEWNGSSWTNGGTVNDTFSSRGATGSITLALIWGGDGSPARVDTEQYNGSAWTEVNDLNNGGGQVTCGPTGTYTDTITAGRGTGNWQANSESWNGSTWTETADLNTARRASGAGGASSTNSLVAGGNVPPNNATGVTESWDGTSWTETGDLNTSRFAVTGFGNISTAVGITGGGSYPALPPYNTKTEFFNGTTWTEVNDLTNGRYHNKGGGSGASALTAGGYLASPAGGQSTENLIWEANLANKTITAS